VSARPGAVDWGLGHYETAAAQLLPAAEAVVGVAAPSPDARVLDVGCGTGNAALLAARRGARVTGVDPAARLLEVATERAAAERLDDVAFALGDAAALPVADDSADVVVSVFGVIFASDAEAAAAELARVCAAGGRIVLSAWLPEGPLAQTSRASREAVARALGAPAGPPPFGWHDREKLAALFGPHGFEVTTKEERISFTADSPRAFVEAEAANHPLAVAGRQILEPRGESDALFERLLAIHEAANEDPGAFRVTSRYVIASMVLISPLGLRGRALLARRRAAKHRRRPHRHSGDDPER
jgi:SAM-dependent methyltransferase